MIHYADTSFLASFNLVNDARHAHAVAVVASLPVPASLPLSPFGLVELRNVFARLEWKGMMHRAESEALMRGLRDDIDSGFYLSISLPSATWLETGLEIVRDITPRSGTRTLDALHLALARAHGCRIFLSFDGNQRRAARAAGFDLLPLRLHGD